MTTKTDCGNCGKPEAVRPKMPRPGECDCLELTDCALQMIRVSALVRRTQSQLSLLDELSMFPLLRLDAAHSPKIREALDTLARFAHAKLTSIGRDVETYGGVCDTCEGTGVLPTVAGITAVCDCQAGEDLYK